MKKLKILELTEFSAGICGVWQRVKQESLELSKKGYNVRIFSSNAVKGSDKLAKKQERLGKIHIERFPYKKLGGESFMFWFNNKVMKKAIKFNPDIIIAHNYRHLHTTQALKVKKKLRKQGKTCKVFLVTHAPFVEGDITRTKLQSIIVKIYDLFIGPLTLNKFDKILTISHWEIPYLIKCGARKNKIIYLPNGIPDEFFTQRKSKENKNKILFLGRVTPIKNLETLILSIPHIKNKNFKIEIVGPIEYEYFKKLSNLVEELGIKEKVTFSKPIYDLKKKIQKIDSAKIFVLPSRKEGMPQSLIEAMARGKIVTGSNIIAIRDLIKDKENGYLFSFNDSKDLAQKINLALKNNPKNRTIKKNAKEFSKQFRWSIIIKKLEILFKN